MRLAGHGFATPVLFFRLAFFVPIMIILLISGVFVIFIGLVIFIPRVMRRLWILPRRRGSPLEALWREAVGIFWRGVVALRFDG
jgi:hypothetical protein